MIIWFRACLCAPDTLYVCDIQLLLRAYIMCALVYAYYIATIVTTWTGCTHTHTKVTNFFAQKATHTVCACVAAAICAEFRYSRYYCAGWFREHASTSIGHASARVPTKHAHMFVFRHTLIHIFGEWELCSYHWYAILLWLAVFRGCDRWGGCRDVKVHVELNCLHHI